MITCDFVFVVVDGKRNRGFSKVRFSNSPVFCAYAF